MRAVNVEKWVNVAVCDRGDVHSRRGRLCIAVEEETLLIVNIGHKSELDSDVKYIT